MKKRVKNSKVLVKSRYWEVRLFRKWQIRGAKRSQEFCIGRMLGKEWRLLDCQKSRYLEGSMPKTREAFKVQARLSTRDERRLKKLVEAEKVSIADFVRAALLDYMTKKETKVVEESERELVAEFKRGVNRLAGLLVQNYLEIGEVRNVLFERSHPNERVKDFQAARKMAVQRLKKTAMDKDDGAEEVRRQIADEISS